MVLVGHKRKKEMNKRPTSITVIAWILIILGGFSLIPATTSLIKELMGPSLISPPIEYALIYLGVLSYLVSGIAILKAQNWARFLFIVWQVFYYTIRMSRNPFAIGIVPSVFIFLIVPIFFLFRPRANDYFAGREVNRGAKRIIITGPEEKLMERRKVFSIICYVISGIFFNTVGFLAFLNKPSVLFKLALLGVFFLFALLFLGIGLVCARFQNWYRHVGLVCTWAAGYGIFTVLSTWFLFMDPKFKKAFPVGFPGIFNGYFSGAVWLALLGTVGILFMIISKKKVQPSGSDGDSDDLLSPLVS
jgi:MFS family permease